MVFYLFKKYVDNSLKLYELLLFKLLELNLNYFLGKIHSHKCSIYLFNLKRRLAFNMIHILSKFLYTDYFHAVLWAKLK